MRLGAVFPLAALVVVTGAIAAPTPNVRGVLVRGPAGVVCPRDEPCDPPATGAFVFFARGERVVARTLVGASGSFALRLAPGTYTIRLGPPPLTGEVRPSQIRVPQTGVVRLRLVVDAAKAGPGGVEGPA